MNIWTILEIAETKDKEAIKNAYRSKLLVTNPEDRPDEFKALRGAYEEALAYADRKEETAQEPEDTSPEGQFIKRVEQVYRCFPRRLLRSEWEQLLEDDICQALDTKIPVRNRLLAFLTSHYRLPQAVWQLLDDTFQFRENKAELEELFPPDFIEYAVIFGIDHPLSLKFELFEGPDEGDYDEFIGLYFDAQRAIDGRRMEEAKDQLCQMRRLDIYHPYMDILQIRVDLIEENFDQAQVLAEKLYGEWENDTMIRLYMGEAALFKDDTQTARTFYEQVLAAEPQEFLALFGLVTCFEKEGNDREAKEHLLKMLDIYPNNAHVFAELEKINSRLIEQYEAEWAADKENVDAAHELGWCYIQTGKIKEGLKLVPTFKPAHKDRFAYVNLCGRLYLADQQHEKALACFAQWEEMGKDLAADGSAEVTKELGRRELPVYLQSAALAGMERWPEALACVERSLAIKIDKNALFQQAMIYYQMKEYQAAIESCDRLQEEASDFWNLYLLRGKCLYHLGDQQQAFDEMDQALRYYPYSLEAFIYKIRILYNHKQYDQARELVAYLEEREVKSQRLMICKAQLLTESEDKEDQHKARRIFRQVIDEYEKAETDLDWPYQPYYLLALALTSGSLMERLALLNKALALKPDALNVIACKAYLYREDERWDEAIICYKKMLEIEPENAFANENLGFLLFEKNHYQEALVCFERLNQVRKNDYSCEMLGRCYLEFGRWQEALSCFKESIFLNPQEASGYHFASLACLYLNDPQKGVEYSVRAVELMEANKNHFRNGYRLLAQQYERLGQADEAMAALLRNQQLFGDEEHLHLMYAQRRRGAYEKAEAALLRWHELSTDEQKDKTRDSELASIYFFQKRWEEGYRILTRIKEKKPQHLLQIWGYHMLQGHSFRAKGPARQYIKDYPKSHLGYLLLARTYTAAGQKKKAAAQAAKSLELLQDFANDLDDFAYYACERALCKIITGDLNGALAEIKTANESHLCVSCWAGECYEACEAMAFYYEVTGEYEKAMAEYEKALAIYQNNSKLLFEAERMRKRMKRK